METDKKAILSAKDQLEVEDIVKVAQLITKSLYEKSTDNSEGLIIKYENINDFIETTSHQITSYYDNIKYKNKRKF